MSDGTEKRERRQFEPPPWEREAFDELAKRRAVEQPAPPEAGEHLRPESPDAGGPPAPVPTENAPAEDVGAAALEPKTPRIPDAQVDAMLMSLAAEEPDVFKDWTIGLWVAAVLGIFGGGIVLYGLLATTRGLSMVAAENKGTAVMMGLLIAGGGAILLGMAGWVGLRAWSRRGE